MGLYLCAAAVGLTVLLAFGARTADPNWFSNYREDQARLRRIAQRKAETRALLAQNAHRRLQWRQVEHTRIREWEEAFIRSLPEGSPHPPGSLTARAAVAFSGERARIYSVQYILPPDTEGE